MVYTAQQKMIRKDRKKIDKDIILTAFPSLERKAALRLRTILSAQETGRDFFRSLIGSGRTGGEAERIELKGCHQTAGRDLAGLDRFERPEIGSGLRPYGELVVDEFVYIYCHNV